MIASAAMGYAGQKCTATGRVICEAPVYDAMRDALIEAVTGLVVEEPDDAACQVGPLITPAARDAALAAVARASEGGGRIVAGGAAITGEGNYLQPTLIEVDDAGAEIAQAEVFAPVCALIRADDADARGRDLQRRSPWALDAPCTRVTSTACSAFTRGLDTGLVRINQPTSGVDLHVPFGGERRRAYGPREQGRAAREFYTSTRTVLISPSR